MAQKRDDKARGKYSVSFGLDEYFTGDVCPISFNCALKSVSRPTPHMQSECGLLFLVRRGAGTMTVNGREFPLKRGTYMCLGPFHNYAITPASGSVLEISQCNINFGAYLYILSCPYVKINGFFAQRQPVLTRLSEADTTALEASFDFISRIDKSDYHENKLGFLEYMNLLGMLIHSAGIS